MKYYKTTHKTYNGFQIIEANNTESKCTVIFSTMFSDDVGITHVPINKWCYEWTYKEITKEEVEQICVLESI